MFHAWQLRPHPIHGVQVFAIRADHGRATVLDDVTEIVGTQAVVDRHDDGANLGHGIEGFQMRMSVRRDAGDAVAGRDSQLL